MREPWQPLATLLLGVALIGCDGEGDGASHGNDPLCAAPGTTEHVLTVTGTGEAYDQAFRLHVPPDLAPGAPVVIQLHGAFGNMDEIEAVTGLYERADEEGFVVVTPNGYPVNDGGEGVWNAGAISGPTIDHVTILTRVVEEALALSGCGDPDRVFFAGQSNGGMMSYRMACQASDLIRGIIVSAGYLAEIDQQDDSGAVLFVCDDDRRPVSILHLHGLQDPMIPYDGDPSIEDEIAQWVEWNHCGEPDSDTEDEGVRRRVWSCDDDTALEFVTIADHGHPWPGSPPETFSPALGPMTDRVDATDELVRFVRDQAGW
jgi:polyhydroxybutyrate depolymerase